MLVIKADGHPSKAATSKNKKLFAIQSFTNKNELEVRLYLERCRVRQLPSQSRIEDFSVKTLLILAFIIDVANHKIFVG